jgi:hypothetical protein
MAMTDDEAVRLLREIVQCYDDFRSGGDMPSRVQYQFLVGAIERARNYVAPEEQRNNSGNPPASHSDPA